MSTDETTPLLRVEHLVTQYPIQRGLLATLRGRPRRVVHALDDVSLRVHKGEMVAIVGESGCGKTTMAQTITRVVDPVSGSIYLSGQDITKLDPRQLRPIRRRMQLIYQDPYESLDPRSRVREAIIEPLVVHRLGESKAAREQRMLEALDRSGLTPPEVYARRYPHELSGGQRQRVAIAAALALEPQLLIADEPVSMLDLSVRAGILSLLDDLRRAGLGVLMITHDFSTAAHYADRIIVMYLGRVVEEGPAKDVIRHPQHPYTKALISVIPNPNPEHRQNQQTHILKGETPDPTSIPSGCRFHPRCPVVLPACHNLDPDLRATDRHNAQRTAACIRVGPSPPAPRDVEHPAATITTRGGKHAEH